MKESEKQADVNEVIQMLSQQVARLTTDNELLRSIINQYQKESTQEPE